LQPVQRLHRIAERLNFDIGLDRRGKLREDVPVRYPVVDDYDNRHQPQLVAAARAAPDRPSTQCPDIIKGIRIGPTFRANPRPAPGRVGLQFREESWISTTSRRPILPTSSPEALSRPLKR